MTSPRSRDATRWTCAFATKIRPELVALPSRSGLALLDGAGGLWRVDASAPAGPGLAPWPRVGVPPGVFRPSEGEPLFVAEGGDVCRLRGDLTLERVHPTGVEDDTNIVALGLANGSILILSGVGAARDAYLVDARGVVAWRGARTWKNVVVSGDHVLAAEAGGSPRLVIIDAATGATVCVADVGEGEEVEPLAVAAGRAWAHHGGDHLVGVALGDPPGGADVVRVPLAQRFPRAIVDRAARTAHVVTAGSLAQRVDLAAARAAPPMDLRALDPSLSEVWPLTSIDGVLLVRSRAHTIHVVDFDANAVERLASCQGLPTFAQRLGDFVFVLERNVPSPGGALLRCLAWPTSRGAPPH